MYLDDLKRDPVRSGDSKTYSARAEEIGIVNGGSIMLMSQVTRGGQVQIPFAHFRLDLEARTPITLPAYKGSTLRGGFGHAFKQVVCALKHSVCSECMLREKCVYAYIFETAPSADSTVMTRYTSVPHPFIIEPPESDRRLYAPGEILSFGLTLIGRAAEYLPYFIYSFHELGERGIGRGRGKFVLRKAFCRGMDAAGPDTVVFDGDSKTVNPFATASLSVFEQAPAAGPDSLSLSFVTPTRLMYDGHLTLDLQFHILIRQLLRRLAMLAYFHCGADTSGIDFRGLIEEAKGVRVAAKSLEWHDWERYSARQDTRMKMGGCVGNITYEGSIGPFMQFIRAGEVLHAGKGTSFGLGKYRIVP